MDNTKYGMDQANYKIDSKKCMLDENTRYKLVDERRRHWGQIRGRYVTACRSYIQSINQSIKQINQLFYNQYRSVIITNYSYVKVQKGVPTINLTLLYHQQSTCSKQYHCSRDNILSEIQFGLVKTFFFLSHSLLMQSIFLWRQHCFPYFHERMVRLQTISRQESQTFRRKANKRC